MRDITPKNLERGGKRLRDSLTSNQVILYRVPEKNDGSLSSLSDLGHDLITIIVEMLYNDSPASLDQLARASSLYYHIARYRQYRGICVNISESTNEAVFQDRLARIEQEGMLSAIRHV
ncbi:unnamed protein product [Clonostachys rosea]|uniref:F-box domain-containing protein n=1 Tax=Bionectria ochroleuca TaxID=29856 RepID=A0ABY6TW62_BIOOC|nr:unnamed protein product [Clonostachys rosea]